MVITVEGVAGASFTGISDAPYASTWHQFSFGTGLWSNSNLGAMNIPMKAYWAKTGANRGADTVTVTTSVGAVTYTMYSWAATDVNVVTTTPKDAKQSCLWRASL
jgi:hypothetical protein